jgi:hypothetical protein
MLVASLSKIIPIRIFIKDHHLWLKSQAPRTFAIELCQAIPVMKLCNDMTDFKSSFVYVFKHTPIQISLTKSGYRSLTVRRKSLTPRSVKGSLRATMKPLILTLALLAVCAPCHAQQDSYAYGQPSDLKGLKKVYVDSGADTKSRDSIIKELEKSKLDFEIVDDEADAKILLGFGAGHVTKKAIATSTGSSVIAREISQRTGSGVVVAHARGKDRLVLSFQDTQNSKWERNPVTNFVREFIKVYKKGNDIK